MREHKNTHGPNAEPKAQESSGGDLRQRVMRHRMMMKKKKQQQQQQRQEKGGAMDPSVAALFDGTQSTDQEMGTDDKAIKEQAATARLALQKHVDDFAYAAIVATKDALAAVAGLGKKGKPKPDRIAQLAKLAIKLAWNACGAPAEIQAVMGIAKEELLGSMEPYVEKGYEFAKGQLEKAAQGTTIHEMITHVAEAVTRNTTAFCDRARAGIAHADPHSLANQWRLISGTRDNLKHADGEGLDEGQKETVTTEMLETMTGIKCGGAFSEQLRNTILQEAQVMFAESAENPTERKERLESVASGEAMAEGERAAKADGDQQWIDDDKQRRKEIEQ